MDTDELMTLAEAAEYLVCSVRTITRYQDEGTPGGGDPLPLHFVGYGRFTERAAVKGLKKELDRARVHDSRRRAG